MLTKVSYKDIQTLVVKELKQYRALRVQLENKQEREAKGIKPLFPSLGTDHQENELRVRHLDNALNALDDVGRQIIELKYLSKQKQNDLNIYLELGLQKKPYYEEKKAAILSIASALGMI